MTHTPGPWFHKEDEECWELYAPHPQVAHPMKLIKAPKKSNEYACYWPDPDDATLIAAAPDLLAALEPFAYLARVLKEGEILQHRGVYITKDQAQAAADAVARAKGEQ